MSKQQPTITQWQYLLLLPDAQALLARAFHHATSADDRETALFIAEILAVVDAQGARDLMSFWWSDDVS